MAFKVTVNKTYCKGCGLCIEVCPRKLLSLTNDYNQQGQPLAQLDRDGICIGCRQCALICPDAAIEIEQIENNTSQKKKRCSGEKSAADVRQRSRG
ncbi:MAG: 4Fe-4S dicluster domain-containing protein [Kiritimatiellia bacterium]|jgi:2-oxoglutarate ferredoxin oxidoreductase subunit delta